MNLITQTIALPDLSPLRSIEPEIQNEELWEYAWYRIIGPAIVKLGICYSE